MLCFLGVSNFKQMKEQIQELENQVKKLKEAYEIEEKSSYENKPHKHFDEGDIVTNGSYIGIVGWTENLGIGLSYDKGYMGISIINGNRGFFGGAKRDEYELVSDLYYTQNHSINIQLTGLEIEELIYTLGYRKMNPNKTKSKLRDLLESVHA